MSAAAVSVSVDLTQQSTSVAPSKALASVLEKAVVTDTAGNPVDLESVIGPRVTEGDAGEPDGDAATDATDADAAAPAQSESAGDADA